MLHINDNLTRIKSIIRFCGNIHSACFMLIFLLEESMHFKVPICFSVCFPKDFPKGEYANLAFSIICLRLQGSISLFVRYSCLSIFSDDNADILLLLC